MNSLTDAKKLFETAGHKVTNFVGYEFLVGKDKFTLASDILFRNGQPISKQELIDLTKRKQNESE